MNALAKVSEKSGPVRASRNMIFFDFFSQFFLIHPEPADVPTNQHRRKTLRGFTLANN
ncbi:hypothetical protein [Caballeronia sp. 15711]|uniref:hypothetical protein n=1 Tax=unclassified Caballeronia TaxID=2646786 RepID=UPI0039E723FA